MPGEHMLLCQTRGCSCQSDQILSPTWFGEFGGLAAGLGLLGLGLLGLGLLGGELVLPRSNAGEFLPSKMPALGQSSTCLHADAPSSSLQTSMMYPPYAAHSQPACTKPCSPTGATPGLLQLHSCSRLSDIEGAHWGDGLLGGEGGGLLGGLLGGL